MDEHKLSELRFGLIQFILEMPDDLILEFDALLSEKLRQNGSIVVNESLH